MDGPREPTAIRARRPPPPFRRAEVVATASRTPRMQRLTLAGAELAGLDPAQPAASVRLLLPHRGELTLPEWNGNEFLHADGSRPHLRTLTPRRLDSVAGEVEVDIVLHGSGPMATWASAAGPGDAVAISGTGRGYAIDAEAPGFLLAGDESALPAISTILAALLAAVQAETVETGTRVWVAGEAASVQRIRRHLFDDLDLPRGQCTVRGYWKHGRAGTDDDG